MLQLKFKMDKFKIYLDLDRSQQYNFTYSLLFQEYIYALAHDRNFKNRSLFFSKKFSLLIVKRLIIQIYCHNFYISFYNYFIKHKIAGYVQIFYYTHILEGFLVILEIPFYLKLLAYNKKNKIIKYLNLQSIHSIFPFLEDNLPHLTFVLDLLIYHPIHIEIFILIIKDWIKDTSVLHLLRSFFYKSRTGFNFKTLSKYTFFYSKRKQGLFLLLYNFYVFEYESIFVFLRNQSSNLRSIAYKNFIEQIYFYKKIELKILKKKSILWLFKDTLLHYVRYKEIIIIASKGGLFFTNKWKLYLIHFWQCHFYVWFNPKRININNLSTHSFIFIGYISSVRLYSSIIQSQMIDNSFINSKSLKKFETLIPINTMIKSFYKSRLCNLLGHPMSKLAWAELSDSVIINQFSLIYRNISHYYSGSFKKKSLYQIKYILKLSCARTLAFKHKSTVRAFINKLGLRLFESFFIEESQFLYLILSKNYLISTNLYKKHIWYFDIISIYELVDR
uniref:Maturase K n=1 Tax=Monotropa uniflora TaxID=50148 RepID=A0A221SR06_MONUN|nr:maturase K [Monotropa uniflora]ASN78964.1 maturase K [Monotropa uniflora]